MPTSMEKPLNGAGLAVVNQVFNERLSQLGGGSGGGVNWAAVPYTGMNQFNNSDAFGCVWLETEQMNAMLRMVRGVLLLHVKAETYAGSQTLKIKLPEGYPALTFNTVSSSVPLTAGTGTVNLTMTGNGNTVTFVLNQSKAAVAKGLYVGGAVSSIVG